MAESRGQMEERLRTSGQMEAFQSRWRDLKISGLDGSAAYQQAVEEFAPKLVIEPLDPDEAKALSQLASGSRYTEDGDENECSLVEAVGWAARYQLVPLNEIEEFEVPAPEAVSMLKLARDPRNQKEWLAILRAAISKSQ
jgi:hypothetical protein